MKKRGFFVLGVYFVLFLLVSIPFYVADVFAVEDSLGVKSVGSDENNIGLFGKVVPLEQFSEDVESFEPSSGVFFVLGGMVVSVGLIVMAPSSVLLALPLVFMASLSSKTEAVATNTHISLHYVKGVTTNTANYAKQGETIEFYTRAKVEGSSIVGEDQIKLRYDGRDHIGLFTCSYADNGYTDCYANFTDTGFCANSNSYSKAYQVKLYKNGSYTGTHREPTLHCDFTPPTVSITSPLTSSRFVRDDNIRLSFSVTDTAYPNSHPFVCSGLKNTVGLSGSSYSGPSSVAITAPSGCTDTVSLDIPATDFSSGISEDVTLTLTVYDKLDNQRQENVTFFVDTEEPDVSDFDIKYNGNPVSYVPNGTSIQLNISVNIADDSSIDTSSVKANLSALGGSGWVSPDSCGSGSSVVCYWLQSVVLTEDISDRLYFKASDTGGSEASVDFLFLLKVDGTGPVVDSITTDISHGNDYYITDSANKITVLFTEESGIDKASMKLNIGSLVTGRAATNCNNTTRADEWKCEWDVSSITGGVDGNNYTIEVTSGSKDVYDFVADSTETLDVMFTKDAPIINSISCENEGEKDCNTTVIVAGDELNFVLNVSSSAVLGNITGDFSEIDTGLDSKPADSCDLNNGYWICAWFVDVDVTQAAVPAVVDFYVENLAGIKTTVNTEFNVTVYEVSEEEVGYWEVSSVSCSPSMIDRQVTTLTNQKVYCSVKLEETDAEGVESRETLAINVGECEGDTDYIIGGRPELVNALAGSVEPYLIFTLKTADFTVNSLDFVCPVEILSLINGEEITSVPETKDVSIKVEFYNLPVGELEDSVQEKIDAVKNDSLVQFELENQITQVIGFATKVCGFLGTWHGITNSVAGIGSLLGLIPGAEPAAKTVSDAAKEMSKNGSSLMAVFYNTCKYVSCDATIWGSWYNGYKLEFKLDSVIEADPSLKLMPESDWLKKAGYSGNMWPASPKDSLVLSLATGCLPGILKKLHDYRQIRCNYAICLRDSGLNNVPIKACEDSQNYLICKTVVGEVFQLIPYADFFKRMFSQVSSLFTDPLGMIFGIWDFACELGGASAEAVCVIGVVVPQLAGVANDLYEGFIGITENENFFQSAPDVCEEFIEEGAGIGGLLGGLLGGDEEEEEEDDEK